MPTIPTGVQMDVAYAVETTNGVAAAGTATDATYLRRVKCDLDQTKDTYESDEIIKTYQVSDFRHGMKKVQGPLNGRLAPGAYSKLMGITLRRDFTTGAISTATTFAAVTGGFTDTGTGFLARGYKVGEVVSPSGFTGAGTGNNGRYYLTTSVSSGSMAVVNMDGSTATIVADASGESVVITTVGKKTYVPSSGHTNKAVTIEKLYGTTTPISEVFVGCKPGTLDIGLPSTGLASCDIGFTGVKRVTPLGTSAYFTAPAAANTNGLTAAVNGAVLLSGTVIAVVTNAQIKVDGGLTTGSVVGSNITPDVFVGKVRVTGQLDAYLQDSTLVAAFDNETELSVVLVLTVDSSAAPKFVSFILPRLKLGGASKPDGEGGMVITCPFTALYNSTGGAGTSSEQTTIVIQDSDAA